MPKTKSETTKKSQKTPAKATVAKSKKKIVTQTNVKHSTTGARVMQVPRRIWYKPETWKYSQPVPAYAALPKARILFVTSVEQLWSEKRLFGGIVMVYGVLNLLLVRGFAGSSGLENLKHTINTVSHSPVDKVTGGGISFIYLLASSGSKSSGTSGIYQSILLIICSLAFIWALRQMLAGNKVRIRDSFYSGMYPLIPFVLLFFLIGIQLLPLVLGGGLFATVTTSGIAAHFWEKAVWLGLFLILGLWSLRMITASAFALYIVTLPEMTPIQAYRKAKRLVYCRRLQLWRKIIFLPIFLLLLAACIEIPLILFVTPLAVWTLFIISMVALPIVHSYLYNLYRGML